MAVIVTCPYCKHESPGNSLYCNSCGKEITLPQEVSKPPKNKTALIVVTLLGLILIGLIGWVIIFTPFGGTLTKIMSGPPDEFILNDMRDVGQMQIINKSQCPNLPAELKALNYSEIWIVGHKGSGPYAITMIYAKQAGEWRRVFSSKCP